MISASARRKVKAKKVLKKKLENIASVISFSSYKAEATPNPPLASMWIGLFFGVGGHGSMLHFS